MFVHRIFRSIPRSLVGMCAPALLLLAACGGSDSPAGPVPPGNGGGQGGGPSVGSLAIVRVLPRAATIGMGGTTRLSAATTDASGRSVSGVAVGWESLTPGVAAVSGDGTVTGKAAGQARIVARAQGLADTAVVVVEATPDGSVTIEPGRLTLRLGTTGSLTAVVRDGSGAVVTRPVTWRSDAPATVEVSGDGVIRGSAEGVARVIATSGGYADTARITVVRGSSTGVVARIAVEPSPVTVAQGRNAQLTALAYDADGALVSNVSVTWRSLDPGVAQLSAGGTVSGVAQGTARVIATVGNIADTVLVTVGPPPVASVVLSPRALAVQVGATGSLSATARDDRGNTLAGRKIGWRSDNAGVVAVSSDGVVTGVSAGTARIIASSEGKADTAVVTASSAASVPASVSVAPNPVTISVGASQALTAVVRDQGGSAMGAAVTWTTSDASVATVSGAGIVTAVGPGSATITARAGSVSGGVTVTVANPVQASVSKQPTDIGSIGEQDGWAAQLPGVLLAGDNDDSDFAPLQAFITYSLADLPTGARVEGAKLALMMEPAGVFGTPFELGGLYVEWAGTLSLNTAAPGSGSVLVTSAFAGVTSTDVTALVKAARTAGATSVTFRVRFAQPRNNNGITDQLELAAGALQLTYVY